MSRSVPRKRFWTARSCPGECPGVCPGACPGRLIEQSLDQVTVTAESLRGVVRQEHSPEPLRGTFARGSPGHLPEHLPGHFPGLLPGHFPVHLSGHFWARIPGAVLKMIACRGLHPQARPMSHEHLRLANGLGFLDHHFVLLLHVWQTRGNHM